MPFFDIFHYLLAITILADYLFDFSFALRAAFLVISDQPFFDAFITVGMNATIKFRFTFFCYLINTNSAYYLSLFLAHIRKSNTILLDFLLFFIGFFPQIFTKSILFHYNLIE